MLDVHFSEGSRRPGHSIFTCKFLEDKMGTMAAPISSLTAVANEFREELAITKRVLDRVPGDKLAWKPHEKSMSLGQLAWHVATVPGGLGHILQQDSFDVTQGSFVPPCPKTLEEVLAAFDQSARDGEQFLKSERQLE
jgi:uncharacterized damage-inducible protein DinB